MKQITTAEVFTMLLQPIKKMLDRFKISMQIRAAERDIDLYVKQIEDAQRGLKIRSMDCAIAKSKLRAIKVNND